jgi:hypothetical protein
VECEGGLDTGTISMMGGGGRSSLFRNLKNEGRCRDRELVLDLLAAAPPLPSSPGGGVLSSSGLKWIGR